MSVPRDTCVDCKFFYFTSPDGYCETCATDTSLGCIKGIWNLYNMASGESDLRKYMKLAQTCEKFEPFEVKE